MKQVVHIVNAFTSDGAGGNPAGVVLDADRLRREDKLAIARAVGLSETAFVSRSDVADIKLEFFTPNRQIAHCGHATIATFNLLAERGEITNAKSSKETIDGVREILLRDGAAFMEQTGPSYFPMSTFPKAVNAARILDSLGMHARQLAAEPLVVATGNRFLLVHAGHPEDLATLAPNPEEIAEVSEALDLIGYYVFAQRADEFAATARMFGPRYAIPEEAATGMAAGPLACYLHDRLGVRTAPILIEQGAYMKEPSPSRLQVELEVSDGRIRKLFVGGRARVAKTVTVVI